MSYRFPMRIVIEKGLDDIVLKTYDKAHPREAYPEAEYLAARRSCSEGPVRIEYKDDYSRSIGQSYGSCQSGWQSIDTLGWPGEIDCG